MPRVWDLWVRNCRGRPNTYDKYILVIWMIKCIFLISHLLQPGIWTRHSEHKSSLFSTIQELSYNIWILEAGITQGSFICSSGCWFCCWVVPSLGLSAGTHVNGLSMCLSGSMGASSQWWTFSEKERLGWKVSCPLWPHFGSCSLYLFLPSTCQGSCFKDKATFQGKGIRLPSFIERMSKSNSGTRKTAMALFE